jgi:hypothetical protein
MAAIAARLSLPLHPDDAARALPGAQYRFHDTQWVFRFRLSAV